MSEEGLRACPNCGATFSIDAGELKRQMLALEWWLDQTEWVVRVGTYSVERNIVWGSDPAGGAWVVEPSQHDAMITGRVRWLRKEVLCPWESSRLAAIVAAHAAVVG